MKTSWAFWRAMLNGEDTSHFPVSDGTAYPGYWHTHDFKRAGIWPSGDKLVGSLDGKGIDPARLFEMILNVRKPGTAVSHEAWLAHRDQGTPWPRQVELAVAEREREELKEEPTVGHNKPPELTLDQDLFDRINELARTVKAEENRIKLHPELRDTEETAKFFSNQSAKALALFQEAEAERTKEKAPHLNAGRMVDAKWKRVTEVADMIKKLAADLTMPYHERIRREKAALDKRANENRDLMSRDSRIQRAPGVTKAVEYDEVVITDLWALGDYFLTMKEPPNELIVLLGGLAGKRVAAGINDIPGIRVERKLRASN